MHTNDHHSEYLDRAIAELTPDGRTRVDEILGQLAAAGASREWVVRFALARRAEANLETADAEPEPRGIPGNGDLDVLHAGFTTIRDTEPLDEVADWANAVLALLDDMRS